MAESNAPDFVSKYL